MFVYLAKLKMARPANHALLYKGNSLCLNRLLASRMLGDAWLILLINTICLIIIGARTSLTPKPHITMKGNQGIPVPAWIATKVTAVALKTGAPQAQIQGRLNVLAAYILPIVAASDAAVAYSYTSAAYAWVYLSVISFCKARSLSGSFLISSASFGLNCLISPMSILISSWSNSWLLTV